MLENKEAIIPIWPDFLQNVDLVKLRFVLDFVTPCALQPSDILGLGKILKLSARQLPEVNDAVAAGQWEALFQPALSNDPVALRKHQKPAPAFIMSMPVTATKAFDAGDQLNCEVLFVGTGIPLAHMFLRSLIHLGRLGLVAGEGQYDVAEVYSQAPQSGESLVWRQGDPLASLSCSVFPLSWVFKDSQLTENILLEFITPTRLMVAGKPLRKPRFSQIFPFMLRRVTSMLYAHCGIELQDDMTALIEQAQQIECLESRLEWRDWRTLGQQGLSVGGFLGEIKLNKQGLEEIFWVLVVASLFGVGKGATYGAGQLTLCR